MLAKKKRLTRALFKPLLAARDNRHSPHFWLKAAPDEAFRLGVSVSKKVAKSAVVRNRVRRRVYSAISRLEASPSPALYLVVAKNGAEKMEGAELLRELEGLFKKR
jgi:ribonuclease P protein component